MIEINLPWPPAILSPNRRDHWAKKSTVRKKYKQDCGWVAKTVRPNFPEGEIKLSIRFYPPDKRRRDMDNMLASLKSGLDGIAETWGVNDSRFRLELSIGPPVKNGSVVISIDDAIRELMG